MNSKMRVLIIGASGFIGNILLEEFSKTHDVLGTFYSHPVDNLVHLDVTDKSEVDNVVNSFKPDVILYPAANPNVEYCEIHPEETWRVNVDGTANIVVMAKNIGAKLVYFSSDYIFDGKNGPYSEEDKPNPINVYGEQKLASEKLIQENLEYYLIIRVTVVYGWERQGKNFVMWMIHTLKNNQTMRVPNDQVGTPTYVNNMCKAVRELVEKGKVGIYHVVGKDLTDRYSFARIATDVFSLNSDLLIPVSTSELGQKASRPLQAGLRIDKTQKELEIELVGARRGLEMMKIDIERRSVQI